MQPMPSVTPMSTERPFPRGQVVVCQYDFNFHLTYVNPAFARMLGYSREELVGQPLKRIAHPGIPQALLDDIRATTGRGQPWRGMAKTLRRDGGYVWSESLIIPVLKRGEVTGYMSIRSEASPQRIAAEEQRYRDIHAGARRYHEGRGPDWTRVTAFHLLATLGAAATLSALCAGLLWWAPAWLAGREGGLAALAGGCWLLTLLSARWLGRRTLRGLGDIIGHFHRMAEGDLSHEIPVGGQDEVGRVLEALAVMQGHLQVLLDEVGAAAHTTEQENLALLADIDALGQSAQQRLDEMAQLRAISADNLAAVDRADASAQACAEAARDSLALAAEGRRRLTMAADAAADARATVDAASDTLNQLEDALRQVEKMSALIGDIAAQTHLLALNAAIEAARAGESGRGFAVVADEVRKLAEHTSGSIASISQRAGDIRGVSQHARHSMQAAARHTHSASAAVDASRDTVAAMAGHSEAMSARVGQIAQACAALSEAVTVTRQQVETAHQQTGCDQHRLTAVNAGVTAVRGEIAALAERIGRFRVARRRS